MSTDPRPRGWRFLVGTLCFGLSWTLPLLALLAPALHLPPGWSSFLVGVFTFWGPNVLGVLSMLLLKKEELSYLSGRILGALKPSAHRYYFALTLMCVSSAAQWVGIYVPGLLGHDETTLRWSRVILDLIFLSSLLLAGEQFWTKLKLIFVYTEEPGEK